MTETKNTGEKTLSVPGKTLSLKRSSVEQGMVRQSLSDGRSKAVVVEKVKRRLGPGEKPVASAAPAAAPVAPLVRQQPTTTPSGRALPPSAPKMEAPAAAPRAPSGVVLRTLTEEEREARARALVDSRSREEEDRRQAEIDAKARAERQAREHSEREAAEARKREEDARHQREAETKRKAEEAAQRRLPQDAAPGAGGLRPSEPAEERRPGMLRRPPLSMPKAPLPARPSRGGEKSRGRLTVTTATGGEDERTRSVAAIRHANVVSGEAGGITQHIGAYQVTAPSGQLITFIDTPSHAAFTAMRARGAKVTDIVVLVVAADDGVMPQTIEAINHARAAKVPMIVAINKIDKPDAKPERVRTELLQHDVQVESMGGETLEIEVSATKHTNLDKLLEAIALQAELLDLRANPERAAEGTVIEARLDRGRGPVATVLVQRGTLDVGDLVVAGSQWGRVRALLDDKGEPVLDAGPSAPVEVLGFSGAPEAGDRVAVVESEARAREITEYRERQKRDKIAARGGSARSSLAEMMSQVKTAGRKEFPLLIKGDVQGSVEAIIASLEKLGTEEVGARVIHAGVGGMTESDITLAEASNAAVIGFNVRAHKEAREEAERAGIEIRYYNIIYNLVDDVKAAMSGLLAPTLRETMLGNAQILEVFTISKVGKVAGCRVTDGTVERGANVRLIRDNVVVHEGKLSTLKRFKDEVREVQAGQECGMAFENYQDMRAGDVIECYRVEEIKRTL